MLDREENDEWKELFFQMECLHDIPHLDDIVMDFGKDDENENNYYFWSLDGVTKHRNKWLQKQ